MRVVHASVRVACGGAAAWLTLRDEARRVGRGEACPMPGRSIDGIDACVAALRQLGAHAISLDEGAPVAESIPAALAPFDVLLDPLPAARFAIETALLDLVAQSSQCAIAELVGGARAYHAVTLNALLRVTAERPVEAIVAAAIAARANGVHALKIKIVDGGSERSFARGVRAVEAVRAALPEIELRVDMNGSLSIADAHARLAALAPFGVRYVEQPVSAEHLLELGATAVPWAADETLALPGAAVRLAQGGRCAAFVVKPTFLGGLLRARAIAELGLARGVAVVVTHAFEGPIALGAACELALSLSRPPLACGLVAHERLAAFPRASVRHLRTPGLVRPSDAPGLGVAISGDIEGHGVGDG